MPTPTPTDEQIAAIEREIIKLTSQAQAQAQVEINKLARVVELTKIDNAFKAQFDYFNDDIITHYDTERRKLDGNFIASPITETDLVNMVNLTGRLLPTPPVTSVVRINEFDGGNLITDVDNESQHILDQAIIEGYLVSGYGGTSPTITGTSLTSSSLDGASTSLSMEDTTGPMSFSVGDIFVVHDGGSNASIVEVTSVTDDMGGDPPYEFTLGITVLLPPASTLSAGSSVELFSGFTNGERSSKTAADPNLQPVMNSLISNLETEINARIANLSSQIAAIDSNEDDDGVSELAIAKTNAQTSSSFLTTYLSGTDISDSGLSSLSTERGVRGGQITSRVSEILAAYTSQTINYYDARYNTANARANLATGFLRRKIVSQKVSTQVSNDQTLLANTIILLDDLL